MAATMISLDPAERDPLACPGAAAELPGLPAALDEATMASLLGRTLHPGGHRIALCRVRSIRYLPGRGCVVRYDAVTGADTTVTVTARVHPSADAARREHADRLRPLAHRLGAPGTIAVLPGLRATVSVYPIDAGLPTLLDATDRARAGPLLADSFGRRPLSLEVTTHRYRGADRVMLRYDEGGRTLAYGKVAADDRGEHANAALTAAARVLALLPADRRFDVPRPLGYAPPLRLQLLGVVPGAPVLSDLLRGCARGAAPPAPALSAAVAGCAEVAAALHELALPPAGRRSAEGEIERLHSEIASVARIAPSLGGWLENRLAGAAAELSASAPLAARPSHGDLKHNQILFDGRRWALVDFDTVCLAEPALDLGNFLAYLRLKATGAGEPCLASRLADEFLDVYADAAATGAASAELRERVHGYETLSLLGRAVHSWQKRKPRRLEAIARLLEGPT
ncbi:MAG TPA: phosphotransferase [Gaiellales bacterium]|nr:phosphotransferase [Gaiellales bacterium]